jgi:hypothetical protein
MPPLKPIDRAEVAFSTVGESSTIEKVARPITVPDVDAFGRKKIGVCRALDEPEKLFDNAAKEDTLGREKRQSIVGEGEPERWRCKDGQRPGPCPIGLERLWQSDGNAAYAFKTGGIPGSLPDQARPESGRGTDIPRGDFRGMCAFPLQHSGRSGSPTEQPWCAQA